MANAVKKLLSNLQVDLQAGLKAEAESKLETSTNMSPEAISNTVTEPNPNAISEIFTESNASTIPNTETNIITDTYTYTYTSPIAELKASLHTKKKKFEDGKKQHTVWMTVETIAQLDKLVKRTGKTKFEIVEIAIQEIYNQVFGEETKK
jgi:RNA processing factor Prp31